MNDNRVFVVMCEGAIEEIFTSRSKAEYYINKELQLHLFLDEHDYYIYVCELDRKDASE
tara:strand:- start:224 stop:400 length:177 start_codon:yes stop_codon:yes gene_type:complete